MTATLNTAVQEKTLNMGCGETRQTSFLKQSTFHNPHVKERAEVKIRLL